MKYFKKYIYIDEIIDETNIIVKNYSLLASLKDNYMTNFSISDIQMKIQAPFIDNSLYELCCILIHIIDKKILCENEKHTTILVFLPGIRKIQAMQDYINIVDNNFEIL